MRRQRGQSFELRHGYIGLFLEFARICQDKSEQIDDLNAVVAPSFRERDAAL